MSTLVQIEDATIPIERGVPVPEEMFQSRPVPKRKYPIPHMQIGDSFSYPARYRGSVRALLDKQQRERGWLFTTRKVDDETCRSWRIK